MAGSKYYGQFGGQYVSESLMNTLAELEKGLEDEHSQEVKQADPEE